jgi:TRAP-type mannitol/chloroaromatic compound transport system permease small subunit
MYIDYTNSLFFNYLVITLNAIQRKNLRLYYSKFNPKYRVFFGILGIIFFLFILFFMCLRWFYLMIVCQTFQKRRILHLFKAIFTPYISAIIA